MACQNSRWHCTQVQTLDNLWQILKYTYCLHGESHNKNEILTSIPQWLIQTDTIRKWRWCSSGCNSAKSVGKIINNLPAVEATRYWYRNRLLFAIDSSGAPREREAALVSLVARRGGESVSQWQWESAQWWLRRVPLYWSATWCWRESRRPLCKPPTSTSWRPCSTSAKHSPKRLLLLFRVLYEMFLNIATSSLVLWTVNLAR